MGEERAAERMLADLGHLRLDDAGFEAFFRQLETWVLDHARNEEHAVLPVLAHNLTAGQLVELGEAYRRAKRLAPTRAHPRLPHGSFVMKAAGTLDRVRDLVTMRTAPRVRFALRTRDLGALLRRPPWHPGRG